MPRVPSPPTDRSCPNLGAKAGDPASIHRIVGRNSCVEGAVYIDDAYVFSIRLTDNGYWTMFPQKSDEAERLVTPLNRDSKTS
jgi:hypothetical protein